MNRTKAWKIWDVLPWLLPLLAFLGILLLGGCSPRVIEHTTIRTEYVTVEKVDTTILRDSVFVRELVRGDTVYLEKVKDRYVYKYIAVRDSVFIHDTTALETVREVKVEKDLSLVQRAKLGLFWYLLVAVLLLAVWTFRKYLIPIIKTLLKI